MLETEKYSVVNIRHYLNGDNSKIGADRLRQVLSDFSCPMNPDVEHFLKNNAIAFAQKKSDTYIMPAYLIAQLGKNFSINKECTISGTELMELAWDKMKEAQYMLGGTVAFLEAENREKLLSFYHENRFSQFDTRRTTARNGETHELVQLLRLL